MCLGFDGRTVSAEEAETLERILQKKQVHFSVNEDLIGNIWNDRPALSCEPVMELSEKWAGRSRADKIREIRSKLKEKGADLFILTSLDDIAWLLNIRGNDIHCCPVVLSYLVLDDSELRLFIPDFGFIFDGFWEKGQIFTVQDRYRLWNTADQPAVYIASGKKYLFQIGRAHV